MTDVAGSHVSMVSEPKVAIETVLTASAAPPTDNTSRPRQPVTSERNSMFVFRRPQPADGRLCRSVRHRRDDPRHGHDCAYDAGAPLVMEEPFVAMTHQSPPDWLRPCPVVSPSALSPT